MAEKFPLMTYVTGILARLNANSRKPIAYLYNGIRLPALPEWDREKYPYAVITSAMFGAQYWLKVFSEPVVDEIGYGKCRQSSCFKTDTAWRDFSNETDYGEDGIMVSGIVWSNHDILNEDGTVDISASDPIPVYEYE